MIHTDKEYWQRLRKDKRSGIATALTTLAWVVATVAIIILAVPGTQFEARGNPLYWLLMLPLTWWGVSLASYEPGPVRWIKAAQIIAPLVVAAAALLAPGFGEDATPFWVATGVATVASVLAAISYRGSMLEREGPAR